MPQIELIGPTIAAGQSLSDALDCRAGALTRLMMPTAWTEAPLSFQVSTDGISYYDCFNLAGYEITIAVVVPKSAIIVPIHVARAIAFIKFRSGSRESPIAQKATRTFSVAISSDPWILETGAWNDRGKWDDTAAWNDGTTPPRTHTGKPS